MGGEGSWRWIPKFHLIALLGNNALTEGQETTEKETEELVKFSLDIGKRNRRMLACFILNFHWEKVKNTDKNFLNFLKSYGSYQGSKIFRASIPENREAPNGEPNIW